jgi:hypothetical protein
MVAARFAKETSGRGFASWAPRRKPAADTEPVLHRCIVRKGVVDRKLLLPDNHLTAKFEVANKFILHLVEMADIRGIARIVKAIEPNADRAQIVPDLSIVPVRQLRGGASLRGSLDYDVILETIGRQTGRDTMTGSPQMPGKNVHS